MTHELITRERVARQVRDARRVIEGVAVPLPDEAARACAMLDAVMSVMADVPEADFAALSKYTQSLAAQASSTPANPGERHRGRLVLAIEQDGQADAILSMSEEAVSRRYHDANPPPGVAHGDAVMDTPSTTADPAEPTERWEQLRFTADRDARYHHKRGAFYAGVQSWVMFVSLFSSSGVIFGLVAGGPRWIPITLSAIVTALTLMSIARKWGEKSAAHQACEARYHELLALMNEPGDVTAERYREAARMRTHIERDEPKPLMRALQTVCHNEALVGLGYPRSSRVPLHSWERRLAQLRTYDGIDLGQPRKAPKRPQLNPAP